MKSTDMTGILRDADALLVVPPFAGLKQPSLGLHIIQACARKAGFDVLVLYANFVFAREIGEEIYERFCRFPPFELIGEKIFADCAFGGDSPVTASPHAPMRSVVPKIDDIDELAELADSLRPVASEWTRRIVQSVAPFNIPVTGCNNTFQQISASVALLNEIKAHKPETITIVGGANCEGEMAQGILSLCQHTDYVFSGESEQAFPKFLDNVRSGELPANPVIDGTPCFNLDDLPITDFSEYYDQMEKFLPDSQIRSQDEIWLPYESSRGCWWGQKHRCRFCGLNGKGIKYRKKSWDHVIKDLSVLTRKHSENKMFMVDNVMPRDYFKTLIPGLGTALPGLVVSYDTRADLSFEQVAALKKAGVATLLSGVEALSDGLLKLMNKGVTAAQNIALLRFARSVGISVVWHLLHCFPGDTDEQYESTLNLLPLVHHLPPPDFLAPLVLSRFSPYFQDPHIYGINKLRPMETYASVFPEYTDMEKLAYFFEGDYNSVTRNKPLLLSSLEEKVSQWQMRWKDNDLPPPKTTLTPLLKDTFMLSDTRGILGTKRSQFVSREKAMAALFGGQSKTDETEWALENFLCVEIDSQFVPLATAAYEVYKGFEM